MSVLRYGSSSFAEDFRSITSARKAVDVSIAESSRRRLAVVREAKRMQNLLVNDSFLASLIDKVLMWDFHIHLASAILNHGYLVLVEEQEGELIVTFRPRLDQENKAGF
jgi:hypothetical protein